MTLFGDEPFEMHGLPFDPVTAEAILAGKVSADDAPSGFKAVTTLILAAKPQVLAQGAAVEDQVVAAFAAELRSPSSVPTGASQGRSRVLGKVLTGKAAVAVAVLAFGGVAAAAATGSLPSPVQAAAASGLAHVGISIPNPNSHASANALLGSANSKAGNSKSGTGHGTLPSASLYGQCTAYSASGQATSTGRGASSAHNHFRLLLATASAKGETVSQLCAGVKPPSGSSASQGSSSSGSKGSDSKTSSSGHESSTTGPPASVPPVSVPASTGPPASVPPVSVPASTGPPASVPPVSVPASTIPPARG